ncbi:Disease resistance-responsive (dirigent-like protein) family protein [Euphorbia peplus]|nr:Disease resistance-responsive (dirigent-like protein) family protein [Euphorbia peplus]
MQNVLNVTQINTIIPNTKPQIPFPKPRGYFPPKKGIPLPPSFGFSSNYNNNLGMMSFMPKAAPQELEVGSVTRIDEHLFEGTLPPSSPSSSSWSLSSSSTLSSSLEVVGKAQGMFVASFENRRSSHMVALTMSFGNNYKDGLRLFGVYKRGMSEESHIAVIGGIGKYEGANGYAVVKPIDDVDNHEEFSQFTKKLLSFNVYLS